MIPGVTAACAAAAKLGIPLTHRDIARSLHFVTGHGKDGTVPGQDWQTLARGGGTIAAYMASRTLPAVAARLIAAGMAPGDPGALPSRTRRGRTSGISSARSPTCPSGWSRRHSAARPWS